MSYNSLSILGNELLKQLHRHHSTSARELRLNTWQNYQSELVDELSKQRVWVRPHERIIQKIHSKYRALFKSNLATEKISHTILKNLFYWKSSIVGFMMKPFH